MTFSRVFHGDLLLRVLLALSVAWLLSMLGACAQQSGFSGDRKELMTESDEPEGRKRARLRVELASKYYEAGNTLVALDEIKQSLQADPSFSPAYVLRGLVYMRMNDKAQAEESFRRAIEVNPNDADAWHNYGWFLCQQGRHAEAIKSFDGALASPLYGGQAKTLMTKGICQVRMGQLAEAERNLARSYELDASNPVTGYNLANLLFRRGDDSRAQFYIRRLNNSELANAESLWLGIRVERRLNNLQAAQQLALQLERRFPNSPEWAAHQRGAFNE